MRGCDLLLRQALPERLTGTAELATMPSSGGEEPAVLRGLSPAAEGAALPGGDPPLLPGIIAQLRSAAADIGGHKWDKRCKGQRQQARDLRSRTQFCPIPPTACQTS